VDVDYNETWAPVAKLVTLRIFLSLVAILQLSTLQLDIKTAFLNAVFVKPVYDQVLALRMLLTTLKDVTQRAKVLEHIRALQAGGVMLLLKAIYGLKQASRVWWLQLHVFLKSLGFVANKCDVFFYILKLAGGAYVLLLLYVDDIILAATTPALVKHYVGLILKRLKLSCEGPLDRYLGFKIGIDLPRRRASLCMSEYMDRAYIRFRMAIKQSVVTPLMEGIQGALDLSEADPNPQFAIDFEYREKIGVVMYYMICMRPDICYCVQLLARFSSKVNQIAAAGLTHLLQFCYNTRFQKLMLGGTRASIAGFSDSDYGGDRLTRRSVASFMLYLGIGPVDWWSKQHKYVTLSTGVHIPIRTREGDRWTSMASQGDEDRGDNHQVFLFALHRLDGS
jgi:hypothetical protein